MAKITTHILNGVDGTHAAGVAIRLRNCETGYFLFSGETDGGGRFQHEISPADADPNAIYELHFSVAAYWQSCGFDDQDIIPEIVLRFAMPNPDAVYHMPVILGPHSYSTWKSS